MKHLTRKDFLKTSVLGGGAALLATRSRLFAQSAGAPAIAAAGSANGDIRIGVIGFNGQGRGHYRNYLPTSQSKVAGGRLVALCDADTAVLARGVADAEKDNVKVAQYQDFRKMLESPDIDAVIIATPNHWHSLMTIMALQAGKDVYVEKPLSHNIWEGRQAVEAAKKYSKQIVQSGTQNRSSEDIKEAIAFIKSGQLGKTQWVRGFCYKMRESIGKHDGPQAVPASVDYDLWSGPAPLTPPTRNGSRGPIHYDWHWFWNYGGGDMSNQGIHQMDVARWVLGEAGLPSSVHSFGGRFGYLDDAETPNTEVCVFNYAKAPLIFETRGLPTKSGMRAMDNYRGTRVGVVAQCEGGYLTISEAGTVNIYDNDNKKLQTLAKNTLGTHRLNFIEAVKARNQEMANGKIGEAHVSAALCHLGNISYRVGADKTNAQLAEAVKADVNTKDSFDRMIDHLKANSVDVETTKTVVGPQLKVNPETEMFIGSERVIVDAANNDPVRKRTGRGAFTIPEFKRATVAVS